MPPCALSCLSVCRGALRLQYISIHTSRRSHGIFAIGDLALAGGPSVRFGIPGDAEQAWSRLAAAGGSASDISQVLRALRHVWAANSSDPRAFEDWLSELGIDKRYAAREVMLRAKEDFDKFQNAKREETERLVQGIASGPNAREFFLGLQTYPLEFREIAFKTGFRVCRNENLVFLLAALARENNNLIQPWLKHAPPSAIIDNFLRYLKTRPSEIWTSTPSAPQPTPQGKRDIDAGFLFELMSLPVPESHDQLQKLSPSDVADLVTLVEHLFPLLPDERYGESARRQMTYLMCLASPEHPIAANAVAILKRSKEPPETGLLAFLGPKLAAALLSALAENDDTRQAALTAAVLDAMRRHYLDALPTVPPNVLAKARKSRNPILSLSAQAVNLQMGLMDYADFQQILLRVLKADKKGMATLWLAGNPEFLESVAIEKLPGRALPDILEALARREPARLMQFIRVSFEGAPQVSHSNLWNASVRALDRIGGSSADELFVDLVVRHPKVCFEANQPNLTHEPTLSLLSRNIWTIAQRIHEERTWNILFEAASSKISNGSLLTWLKTSPAKQQALKKWILESYLPRLFERELLSASFVADLDDPSSQALLITTLCSRVLSHSKSIQTIAEEWPKDREAQKQKLANRASVGLKIAIRTAQNNQSLQAGLDNLLKSVERWRLSDSPAIDPSIILATEIKAPETRPADAGLMNTFFSSRPKTPHEISFLFGANPWMVDTYLSSPDRSWPKLELAVEQIAKSLVFFANLNERARNSMQELERNTKTDFGIALRDGLDEVEETLAGYFTFRSMLRAMGLDQVEPILGEYLNQEDISSDKHKFFRDSSQPGRLRIFSLGLKVDGRVVGSSKVVRSGDNDDRD